MLWRTRRTLSIIGSEHVTLVLWKNDCQLINSSTFELIGCKCKPHLTSPILVWPTEWFSNIYLFTDLYLNNFDYLLCFFLFINYICNYICVSKMTFSIVLFSLFHWVSVVIKTYFIEKRLDDKPVVSLPPVSEVYCIFLFKCCVIFTF